MGKSGSSPALSRNCNPKIGEARIPALVVALDTFEERGEEQWLEDHDPLVVIGKGFFQPTPPTIEVNQVGVFCIGKHIPALC